MNFTSLHETGTKNMSRLKESNGGSLSKENYPETQGQRGPEKAKEAAVIENGIKDRAREGTHLNT